MKIAFAVLALVVSVHLAQGARKVVGKGSVHPAKGARKVVGKDRGWLNKWCVAKDKECRGGNISQKFSATLRQCKIHCSTNPKLCTSAFYIKKKCYLKKRRCTLAQLKTKVGGVQLYRLKKGQYCPKGLPKYKDPPSIYRNKYCKRKNMACRGHDLYTDRQNLSAKKCKEKCNKIKECAMFDTSGGKCRLKDHRCTDAQMVYRARTTNFLRLKKGEKKCPKKPKPKYDVTDPTITSSVLAARQAVNKVIKETLKALRDPKRKRHPGDLLTLFRLPTANALDLTRAAETYELVLDIISKAVKKERLKVTHNAADLNIADILTAKQVKTIAKLSGCFEHLRHVDCKKLCHSPYRSHDGSCNNLKNPTAGASLTPLQRLLPPAYEDGISAPIGWFKDRLYHGNPMPSARLVSTKIMTCNQITHDNANTIMLMQWGQFMDHDMDFTPVAVSNARYSDGAQCNTFCTNQRPCFPISIPADDPRIKKARCLGFTRSSAVCGSGLGSIFFKRVAARQQLNQITSFIDASNVYGSTEEEANNLRNLDNDKGLLKEGVKHAGGQSFLPFDHSSLVVCDVDPSKNDKCFLAGDHRANEQLGLLTLHTIFMRQHNRLAAKLKLLNPKWGGNVIYQEARKIVGAQLQHFTYTHWLPNILGPKGMQQLGSYTKYDPSVSPAILNSFATAAFRFGHGLIPLFIFRLKENFQQTKFGNLPLHKAFFQPGKLVDEGGLDPILRGLFHKGAKQLIPEEILNMDLTEKLFEQANDIALDLAALNIQRGRDHGLPSYNTFRKFCGLKKAKTFEDLKKEIRNKNVRARLAEVYSHPDDIDLFVGGMTENAVAGGKVGPTFRCILVQQFSRLRAGDRLWYEKPGVFTKAQLKALKRTSLANVICENHDGSIKRIQKDVFTINGFMYRNKYGPCKNIKKLDLQPWKDTKPY